MAAPPHNRYPRRLTLDETAALPPHGPLFVFLNLPRDTRFQIYRLLLLHYTCFFPHDLVFENGRNMREDLLVRWYCSPLLNPLNHTLPTTGYPDALKRYRRVAYGLYPAILRTSRQIHDEASGVLYGMNFFHWQARQWNPISLVGGTNRLDQALPMRYIRLLRKIYVQFTTLQYDWFGRNRPLQDYMDGMKVTVKETVDLLKNSANLEELVVKHNNVIVKRRGRVLIDQFDVHPRVPRGFGEDVLRPVAELRGLASLDVAGLDSMTEEFRGFLQGMATLPKGEPGVVVEKAEDDGEL